MINFFGIHLQLEKGVTCHISIDLLYWGHSLLWRPWYIPIWHISCDTFLKRGKKQELDGEKIFYLNSIFQIFFWFGGCWRPHSICALLTTKWTFWGILKTLIRFFSKLSHFEIMCQNFQNVEANYFLFGGPEPNLKRDPERPSKGLSEYVWHLYVGCIWPPLEGIY